MAAVMASTPLPPGPSQRPRLSLQTNTSMGLGMGMSMGPINLNHLTRPRLSIPSSQPHHQQQQHQPQHQHQHQHQHARTVSPTRPTPPATLRCSTTPVTAKMRVQKLSLDTSMASAGTCSSPSSPSCSFSTPVTSKRIKLSVRTSTPSAVSVPSFSLPETPLTAHPTSPGHGAPRQNPLHHTQQQQQQQTLQPPRPWGTNALTTPPLSAEPNDPRDGQNQDTSFSFAFVPGIAAPVPSSRPPRETTPSAETKAPYAHPGSLRSALRNSPLLSGSEWSSHPSQDRPAKKVCFSSPLTHIITNEKYTVSHMDVLMSDDGANSTCSSDNQPLASDNYTRDGGSTPGPWEDVHRRMACLAPSTPVTSSCPSSDPSSSTGLGKRKRKEKIRRWVWTIGVEGEEEEDETKQAGAIAALRAAESAAPVVVTAPPIVAATTIVDSDTESCRADSCSVESPTPTSSMTSATMAEDDDDNCDVGDVNGVGEIGNDDDDALMELDGETGDMELDTPRAITAPPTTTLSGLCHDNNPHGDGGDKDAAPAPAIATTPTTKKLNPGWLLHPGKWWRLPSFPFLSDDGAGGRDGTGNSPGVFFFFL